MTKVCDVCHPIYDLAKNLIPYTLTKYILLLRTNVNALQTRVPRIWCLGDEITIQSSPRVVVTDFRFPAPPLSIQLSIPNIQAARPQKTLPLRRLK